MKTSFDLLENYENDDYFGVADHMHHVARKRDKSDLLKVPINTDWEEAIDNFEDMELSDAILRGVYAYGFERPSAIQQRIIRPIVLGFDLVAQAESGTGKTAALIIGMLARISPGKNFCQGLVVVPTRELGNQILHTANSLSTYLNIKIGGLFGGTSFSQNTRDLMNGLHVVVGTPGRIIALLEKGILRLEHLKIMVLDEVDTLLTPSFVASTQEIVGRIALKAQVVIASATVTSDVMSLVKYFMKNPFTVRLKPKNILLANVRQFYMTVQDEDRKFSVLFDIYSCLNITQAVIFVNTKHKVEVLAAEMAAMDFTVSTIHGDMTQEERDDVMKKFRLGQTRILISSDLTSRGIDVSQVTLVFNYQMPIDRESYIHRIGRTGRFGRNGMVINLVLPTEGHILRDLENSYNTLIEEMPPYYEVLSNIA